MILLEEKSLLVEPLKFDELVAIEGGMDPFDMLDEFISGFMDGWNGTHTHDPRNKK
jgi:hypothetical protein